NEELLSRPSWPRSSFFSSIYHSNLAATDAYHGMCPVIGIVDTNTVTEVASRPVPASDDSYFTIVFLSDLVAGQILVRKYIYFAMWFYVAKKSLKVDRFYY